MEQIQLTVSGMGCAGCAQHIEQALARVDGVLRSSVEHQTGQVRVVFDPARASEQAVRSCIARAGYGVLP
jgi:copper chaperone